MVSSKFVSITLLRITFQLRRNEASESRTFEEVIQHKAMKLRVLSEPFILLYTLTHGIYFTTLPQVLLYKSCLGNFNQSLCKSLDTRLSKVQQSPIFSETTVWNMTIAVSNVVISLIFILPFGTLSDIISKRKLMLIPPVLRLLQSLIFILDIQLQTSYIQTLLTGACLTGLYGDALGALSLGAAYMADGTSDGPERTARMIGLSACIYAGTGIGAFLSGVVANKYGFTYSFVVSVAICIINIVLVIFVLPSEPWRHYGEHIHSGNGEGIQDNPVKHALKATKQTFINISRFATKYCFKSEGTQIWLFTMSYFFGIVCLHAEFAIVALFLKHDPLNFSPLLIGEYTLLTMAVRGVGGFLLFLLVKSIKLADAYVVSLGFFSFIATYITMALSSTQTMLFAFSSLSTGYPLTLSGLRSCLTKRVSMSEHGTVLSFASFVSLLGSVPMMFSINSLFKYTAEISPGISILFLVGCSAIGLILAVVAVDLDKCSNRFTHHHARSSIKKKGEDSAAESDTTEKYPLVSSNDFTTAYNR